MRLTKYRDCGEAELLERQVGDIGAGEELADVEIATRRLPLSFDIVVIHADGKIDFPRV